MNNTDIVKETETLAVRPSRPSSTELCVCNNQSIHDTTAYKGVSRISIDPDVLTEIKFTLLSEVEPLADKRETEWRVEFDPGTFESLAKSLDYSDASLHVWKKITAATIISAVKRKPITMGMGNQSDLIYVDPVAAYKIQRFPAWITLAGTHYEVDIIKKSNGSTSFEVETVSAVSEDMASLIEETVLYWAKKNPVGWTSKPDSEE